MCRGKFHFSPPHSTLPKFAVCVSVWAMGQTRRAGRKKSKRRHHRFSDAFTDQKYQGRGTDIYKENFIHRRINAFSSFALQTQYKKPPRRYSRLCRRVYRFSRVYYQSLLYLFIVCDPSQSSTYLTRHVRKIVLLRCFFNLLFGSFRRESRFFRCGVAKWCSRG